MSYRELFDSKEVSKEFKSYISDVMEYCLTYEEDLSRKKIQNDFNDNFDDITCYCLFSVALRNNYAKQKIIDAIMSYSIYFWEKDYAKKNNYSSQKLTEF